MRTRKIPSLRMSFYSATVLQLVIPLTLLWALRFPFALHNADIVGEESLLSLLELSLSGLRFDVNVTVLFNLGFILLRFLPFRFVEYRSTVLCSNILYFICTSAMLLCQVADIPFFRFNGGRLQWGALTGIAADSGMGNIVFSYASDYWWAFLTGALLLILLGWTAFGIKISDQERGASEKNTGVRKSRLFKTGLFLGICGLCFVCIRGNIGPGRPLSIGDAAKMTDRPSLIPVVLNTPFTILRSFGLTDIGEDMVFFSDEELGEIRSSVHVPPAGTGMNGKNIVVITMESGSALWIDALSPVCDDSRRGLTPFLDSLSRNSVSFSHVMATGVRSIEGITAICGGIPTFRDLILMQSPYYANLIDSPAGLLKRKGYSTRFYFGGNPGSFNIDRTLALLGFDDIKGRKDYGNEDDFDGHWGIWDHKMGEYAASTIGELPEPFFVGWFTLNPHPPFGVPTDWGKEDYIGRDGMARTVEYEDRSLRHFFRTAEKQPWYKNTVFVVVGDHGSRELNGDVDGTRYAQPHICMLIFAGDRSIEPRRISEGFYSQIDIMPTLLGIAGYDDRYFALGEDMLCDGSDRYALSFYKGSYQVFGSRYALRFSPDMSRIEGIYDWREDPDLERPLESYDDSEKTRMARWARAFMQDYAERLRNDRLNLKKDRNEQKTL